jgi:hypothetical protein
MTQVLPSSAYPVRRELRTMIYAAITESNLGYRLKPLTA